MSFKPKWIVVITNENPNKYGLPSAPHCFGFFDSWDKALEAAYFETQGDVWNVVDEWASQWQSLNDWYYQAGNVWVCEFVDIKEAV